MTGNEVKQGVGASKPCWDPHTWLKAKDNVSHDRACLWQIFRSRVTGNDETCSAGFSTALLSWLHVHRWLQEKNSNRSWSRHKGELGCAGIQTRLIWRAQERPGREMSRCQNQWAHQCRSLRQGEKLTGVLPTRSRISSSAWRLLRQCSKQDSSSFQLIHYAC